MIRVLAVQEKNSSSVTVRLNKLRIVDVITKTLSLRRGFLFGV